jgi:hypothetical protein
LVHLCGYSAIHICVSLYYFRKTIINTLEELIRDPALWFNRCSWFMAYWIRTPIGTLFQKAVKMTFTIESVFV